MDIRDVIIKPLVTEGSMKHVDSGKYSFVVHTKADKKIIKQTISALFNVHVVSVATNTVKGKRQRVGKKRTEKIVTAWKKAVVTVKKGEKIGLFEPGGEPTEEKKK